VEAARRALTESEAIVERQRQLVLGLRRDGVPALAAERTLRTMQDALFEQRKHLALLENRHRRGL
jgi:hypothetical protein